MSEHRAHVVSSGWLVRIAGQVTLGFWLSGTCGLAQSSPAQDENLEVKVRQLTESMNQAQKQIEESQHDLDQLRAQMSALQHQIAAIHPAEAESSDAARLSAAVDQIREQQALEEIQIATHEQAKVESESKYPVKLSGLVLLTGFVNTTQVDDPVSPSIVVSSGGSTRSLIAANCAGHRC